MSSLLEWNLKAILWLFSLKKVEFVCELSNLQESRKIYFQQSSLEISQFVRSTRRQLAKSIHHSRERHVRDDTNESVTPIDYISRIMNGRRWPWHMRYSNDLPWISLIPLLLNLDEKIGTNLRFNEAPNARTGAFEKKSVYAVYIPLFLDNDWFGTLNTIIIHLIRTIFGFGIVFCRI